MLDLVHEWGSWLALAATVAGIVSTLTVGRRIDRPAGVAAVWASVALAGGMIGKAVGQRKVDDAFQKMAGLDLSLRVKMLSVGAREASDSLLVGGACALLLLALGGAQALLSARKS